jgi:ribonuclease Z
VQTPDGFILLDCGIGCFAQIRSHYGRNGVENVLRNLKVIWISHYHIDHCQGLVQMLLKRVEITKERLLLCCCEVVKEDVQRIEGNLEVGAFHVVFHDRLEPVKVAGAVIESIPVVHCPGAMGCVLTMGSGERLAFSGDRLVDGQFEQAVGKCDVLIHEGTYTSDLKETAKAHAHTDFGGAIEAAGAVQAKWLFITHLSSRVAFVDTDLPEENAIVAFDHLSLEYERMEEGFRIAKQTLKQIIEERNGVKNDS